MILPGEVWTEVLAVLALASEAVILVEPSSTTIVAF